MALAQPKQSSDPLAARARALDLLNKVCMDQRLLSEVLASGALSRLAAPDRARAQRLALATLRGLDRADALLRPHLQRLPPIPVRNALRLGVVELAQGEASHGVVNAMVTLVGRMPKHNRMKGLVNAVLRKIAGQSLDWDALPASRLPDWLRSPLVAAWGETAIAGCEAVQAKEPPIDLTPREDADALARTLGGALLPTGSIRLERAGQVSNLPGYADGAWWVQDAAAALPARLLQHRQGGRALDLCAAPGGKTMQLAAMGWDVTAVDDSETRMTRLQENLSRTRLRAETVVRDVSGIEGTWDAILLDAPCSATGTLRRHPDLPYAKDGADFADLFALQARMIDHAWTCLAPGGQMVFCTCSLLPDEGEVQIDDALNRHSDMRVVRPEAEWVDTRWHSAEGGLRIRPDHWADIGGLDGFYMALLTRAP